MGNSFGQSRNGLCGPESGKEACHAARDRDGGGPLDSGGRLWQTGVGPRRLRRGRPPDRVFQPHGRIVAAGGEGAEVLEFRDPHELRTPLTILRGRMQGLADVSSPSQELFQSLR